MVQLSDSYTTTGKTRALTRWTFVGNVMSLVFNMLCRFVIAFLPRNKYLLISWLQSSFAVIWEPPKNTVREGDGTPLQDSCQENPMDGGAWWAAISGVAQSRTQLKRLSSSSSSSSKNKLSHYFRLFPHLFAMK